MNQIRQTAQEQSSQTWGRFNENVLRVIVESWNEHYIQVMEPASGTRINVCYDEQNRYLTRGGNGSWDYLQKILAQGDVLNLVRLRWDNDVCMPELIIYQPDFLINITSIAACFDECLKESPFVGLINKVKADEPSVPMHLGNLAGKMLDETVHVSDTPYAESFTSFFHDHALNISCCQGMSERGKMESLQADGEKQKKNIKWLIQHDLPASVGHYDRSKVVLEPSFFSEILGIQGRIDLLYQTDSDTVIVEQKSGKGAFVPFSASVIDPNIPSPVTKHVVQLLLYRALFQYEFSMYADELKHIFLLYSKYSKGLVPVTNNPELLLRAIRMRNLLTWSEIQYTRDGFRFLDIIKPDTLKSPSTSDRFWRQYKEAEYLRILAPLHQASPLERAYYYRFQRFLATEQLFARVGNRVQEDAGFSAVWIDTLAQKKAAGNIYDNLTILNYADSKGTVRAITLAFSEEMETDMSNFRKGDIVFLYPYPMDATPNACAQMVQRGSIVDITTQAVTVQLRNRQTDRKVFNVSPNMRWAIEHDFTDAASSALYRGMHAFLSTHKSRRDLVLLQRQPAVDTTLTLQGNYSAMNQLVLHAKQSRELFLVIGPPGTGKTSFGMLNILQEELHTPDSHILLLSYTNRAVDEMCSKLVENDIDFMRIGSDLSCDRAYRDYLADRRLHHCTTAEQVRQELSSVRVICGTTVAMNSNAILFNVLHFQLAIIDEASQILEPHLIGLLSAQRNGIPSIDKFVLIGDHKQLPAVVQQDVETSSVSDPELLAIGLHDCRLSLFERLLRHFRLKDGNYDERYVYMLTHQGRMHRDIAEFPNHFFYGGKLDIVGSPILPHQDAIIPTTSHTGDSISDMLLTRGIAFVHSPAPIDSPSDKVNQHEAAMMAACVLRIVELEGDDFREDKTIGIIVPYRNQIATVRHTIELMAREKGYGYDLLHRLHHITIDTVERYQGSQREYILYGFTVQHDYQLDFLSNNTFEEDGLTIDRKLNVAMTRARRRLVLFGNAPLLSLNPVFNQLMEFTRQRNSFISVPVEDFCHGRFELNERIIPTL